MRPYELGHAAALTKHGIAQSHPLLRGTRVELSDTDREDVGEYKEPKAPTAKVWPPPPHTTSGTLINPRVA